MWENDDVHFQGGNDLNVEKKHKMEFHMCSSFRKADRHLDKDQDCVLSYLLFYPQVLKGSWYREQALDSQNKRINRSMMGKNI